jgi:coenzyme F420-reducing hydrogenase delta subunit
VNDREETTLQIVAYCCHYCAYAAADLAGVLRLSYPAETRIVEIPCSGRLDPLEVLHALERGADGIMVAGCLEGDCHFQEGNLNARRRVNHIKDIIASIGLEPERIEMFNMSAAMGKQFAEAATEMTEQIMKLGQNPLRQGM